MKRSAGEKVFTAFNVAAMLLLTALVLYPFLNVLATAFNDGLDSMRGGFMIYPRKFSTRAFTSVWEKANIAPALLNSVARTVIGAPLSLMFAAGLAYILSHKDLVFRRFFIFLFVFTMYFSGGMVPRYILMRQLGLLNNFAVYIVPGLLGVYNMMLIRAYFEEISSAIRESAMIDGANGLTIFFRIMLPMSKPVLATVTLFLAVGQWNAWYDTYIYTSGQQLITLQGVLINVLREAQATMYADTKTTADLIAAAQTVTPDNIKNATIVITTLPIIMVYPFLQKYFVKGIMLGAVKG